MNEKSNIVKASGQPKKRSRGRPVVNDIVHLQESIPAIPEELAKVIFTSSQEICDEIVENEGNDVFNCGLGLGTQNLRD